jgi:hypothetical protein
MLCGADRKQAVAYLKRAADVKTKARHHTKSQWQVPEPLSPADDVGVFAWMKAEHNETRISIEVKVLRRAGLGSSQWQVKQSDGSPQCVLTCPWLFETAP